MPKYQFSMMFGQINADWQMLIKVGAEHLAMGSRLPPHEGEWGKD